MNATGVPTAGRRVPAIRLPAGVPTGVLATITMDAAMVAASRLGGSAFTSDRLSLGMVGRLTAGFARGRWHSADIQREPAQRGEEALGLLTHYATGVVLTQAFLQLPRGRTGRPTLAGATAYGVATSVLPLLLMFPAMGYGAFALRTGEAPRIVRIMLLGHTAFGLGIGLWAPCFGLRRPRT